MLEIRHTTSDDIDAVMAIFDTARAFMRAHGNTEQWPQGTPSREAVEADMVAGNSYVVLNEGGIVGTFAFIEGEDPTYATIEDGHWRSCAPYAAVHRVASAGRCRGVTSAVFSYAAKRAPHLRIDTHAKNYPMQGALKKFGFKQAGIIHLENGDPRIAYDWLG